MLASGPGTTQTAPDCRWCGPDKCKLAPPGFYARVKPPGTRIRRFRCKRNGRTVSALPDCFNARMPGSLEALEAAAREAARAASWNAAVEKLRPPGQGRPGSAERWLKRRVQWVSGLLVAVKGLAPERFTGVEPTLAGIRAAAGERQRAAGAAASGGKAPPESVGSGGFPAGGRGECGREKSRGGAK